ncbi:MAG: glycosyl transferase family 2, partial [Gemmatimonadetes bacterium]|nr:glycosyl transferase family 2 [Gemmatimonadota bacterium]
MRLSVVFLSYNTRDLTEQALRTVLDAAEGMEVEIFVVDNASHDGSADMVAEKFPAVKLLRNEDNVGFAAGNNVALRQVVGEYVLIINTDTIVRRDTLRALAGFLDEHPEVGACGCKILDPDGTLQLDSRRGFPSPMAAFCKMSGLSR